MKIFQSSVERLMYFILMLVFVGIMIEIPAIYSVINRMDQQQKSINDGVMDIEQQIACIGAYFNQTDRANLRIPDLEQCNITRVK